MKREEMGVDPSQNGFDLVTTVTQMDEKSEDSVRVLDIHKNDTWDLNAQVTHHTLKSQHMTNSGC